MSEISINNRDLIDSEVKRERLKMKLMKLKNYKKGS